MQRCGDFPDLHLAPIHRKQLQHAREPVNDLNIRTTANDFALSAGSRLPRLRHHNKLRNAARIMKRLILVSGPKEVKAACRKCFSPGLLYALACAEYDE